MHTIDCVDPTCVVCRLTSAGKSSDKKNQLKMSEEVLSIPGLALRARERFLQDSDRVKKEIRGKICELIETLREREKYLLDEVGINYFVEMGRINYVIAQCLETSSAKYDSYKMELGKTKEFFFDCTEMKDVIKQLEGFGHVIVKDVGEEPEKVPVEDQRSEDSFKMVLDHKLPSDDDMKETLKRTQDLIKDLGIWNLNDSRESMKKAQNQANGDLGQDYHYLWMDMVNNKFPKEKMFEQSNPCYVSCDKTSNDDSGALSGHKEAKAQEFKNYLEMRTGLLKNLISDTKLPRHTTCAYPFKEDSKPSFGQDPLDNTAITSLGDEIENQRKKLLELRLNHQPRNQNSKASSNASVPALKPIKQLPTEIDGNDGLNQMPSEGSLNIPCPVVKPIKQFDREPAELLETNPKCMNKFPTPDCMQMTPRKIDETAKALIALKQSTFVSQEFIELKKDMKEIKMLILNNKKDQEDISSSEDDMEIISKSEAASIPSELPQSPSFPTKKAPLFSRRCGSFASLKLTVKKGMSKMGDKKSSLSVGPKDASSGVGGSESSGECARSATPESVGNSPGSNFDKGSASSSNEEAGQESSGSVASSEAVSDPSAALLSTFSKYLSKHDEAEWLDAVKFSDRSALPVVSPGIFPEDERKFPAYWLDKTT